MNWVGKSTVNGQCKMPNAGQSIIPCGEKHSLHSPKRQKNEMVKDGKCCINKTINLTSQQAKGVSFILCPPKVLISPKNRQLTALSHKLQ
jgi:hypothetical protein